MAGLLIDREDIQKQVAQFFSEKKNEIRDFGKTVNQTFEAFVFASVVKWYSQNGWRVEFINPEANSTYVKLKFNTRGRPKLYSYVVCTKEEQKIQIRHSLRVATKHFRQDQVDRANMVLDVAVIANQDLSNFASDDFVNNTGLITFGEAKHMSAFAELIASFIGMVHELMPDFLTEQRPYIGPLEKREHPAPFLYVSGYLYPTAKGITDTIRYRGFDIDIYDHETGSIFGMKLSFVPIQKRHDSKKEFPTEESAEPPDNAIEEPLQEVPF